MKQLTLDMGLAPSPTLERFFAGNNVAVLEHLRGLATRDAPPSVHVPTYLWGQPGAGKTHLLHALADTLARRGEMFGWMNARTRFPAGFDERWGAVLLDDVHAYTERQQARAFSWLNHAAMADSATPRLLLAAGRLPPVDLPLRADLRTRLGWGHVFEVHALRDDETRRVLREEAAARGMLPGSRDIDEVLDYMLAHCARDLGSLMHTLQRLDGFALSHKRAITVPLLRDMLKTP